MPQQYSITLASAPTSGAASTGTTGFDVISGLSHAITTSKMPGDIGSGVLLAAVNTICSFRLGPVSGGNAPFAADAYVDIGFKMRARVELPGSLPADFTINAHQMLDMNAPGFILYMSNYAGGLKIYLAQFSSGTNYQPIFDSIPYGEWMDIRLRVKRAASGVAELFINGALVGTVTGNFASLGQTMNWNFPALAGCAFEFAGPFYQWSGTDCQVDLRTDLQDPQDEITRYFVPNGDSRIHPDNRADGRDAYVTTVSGSPAYAYNTVSSGGNNPRQGFVTVTGAASVERRVYEGELQFNEGWAGLYLPMLYMPAGTTGTLSLYRDSRLLTQLALGNDLVSVDSVGVATFGAATRNGMAVLVGQSGELDVITANQSTTSVATPYISVANLPSWSRLGIRQPPNRWQFDTTIGASGFQMCGAILFNTLRVTGADSMVNGLATLTPLAAPDFQVGANIAASRYVNEVLAVPGVRPWAVARGGGRHCGFNLGRAGQTYAQWVTNVLTPLNNVRGGVKLCIFEGGINDIAGVTTLAGARTAIDTIASCDAQVLAWSKAKPGRSVVIGTIIERSLSTHWSGAPATGIVGVRLSAIRQANINRRAIFAQSNGTRHAFIDVGAIVRPENQAAMIDTGNPPHTTIAGSDLYFTTMVSGEASIRFARN